MSQPLVFPLALLLVLPASPVDAFVYSEDFSTGLGGWDTAGSERNGKSSSLAHNHIDKRASYLDTSAGIGYYLAPTVLTGDLSAAYGGTFGFDIIIPDGMDTGHSDTHLIHMDAFIWATNGDILVIDLNQPTDGSAGESLTTYAIPLHQSAGWKLLASGVSYSKSRLFSTLNVPSPGAATGTQFQDVLANVSQIGFRAEFSDGIDSTEGAQAGSAGFNPESELDSVVFGIVPEPTAMMLGSLGFLLIVRRRNR
ncbi:PEP-CTERM sorting domain-containing protein [Haloferula sp.]|uniref:PEP-CTERM sorting domain-containing protein n=1 Tax=Haloferula sp. TaxID=2497595 RepID=UPI003C7720F3